MTLLHQSSDKRPTTRPLMLAVAANLDAWAAAVERDRHEPDKLLRHVQSMRSIALRARLDAEDE